MSFPNLTPNPSQKGRDAAYHTSAEGAADNGANVFNTGLNPALGIDPDKVIFTIQPLDAGVTAAVVTSDVDPETGEVEITFTGAGDVRVDCQQVHTMVW